MAWPENQIFSWYYKKKGHESLVVESSFFAPPCQGRKPGTFLPQFEVRITVLTLFDFNCRRIKSERRSERATLSLFCVGTWDWAGCLLCLSLPELCDTNRLQHCCSGSSYNQYIFCYQWQLPFNNFVLGYFSDRNHGTC